MTLNTPEGGQMIPPVVAHKMEQVTENILLKFLARVVIGPAVLATLSVVGWFLHKQIDQIERMNTSVIETSYTTKLLQQRFDLQVRARDGQLGGIEHRLKDHEGRIRTLERTRLQ